MNTNNIYILNPAYYLRNDVKRALIGTYETIDPKYKKYAYSDTVSIIHPVIAQMLSFFDGERTLRECIGEIATYFQLSYEEIESIIRRYIENTNEFAINHHGKHIGIPQNILVRKDSGIHRELYTPQQFIINGTVDLESYRLYRPVNMLLELTLQCYTDCAYCYADRRKTSAEYLSLSKIIDIIREAKNLGIANLDINGGEVLLHPGCKEIFQELIANGYRSLISTKIPVSDDILTMLKNIGWENIQISLDSVNPDTLSKILHVDNKYMDKMNHTLQKIDELGFNWRVHSIITSQNSSVEKEIKPLINKLLTFKNLHEVTFSPAGYSLYKSEITYQSIKPKQADIEVIQEYINNLPPLHNIKFSFSGGSEKAEFFCKQQMEHFQDRALCTGNQNGFIVLPDGKVTICEELYWHPKFLVGDLKQQSIQEMWESDKAKNLFYISQQLCSTKSTCKQCDIFVSCRHSRGVCWKEILMAYGENNWDYPDPRCPKAPLPYRNFYLE